MSTEPLPTMFFSTFLYSACKVTGASAEQVLLREMVNLDASVWPCFRTLGQAVRLGECKVWASGETYITRARCVAAGKFLRGAGYECDVWLTCDDDNYADQRVIRDLVQACRATCGLVALPYLNRDGGSMTFRTVRGPTVDLETPSGVVPIRAVDRIGQGLVAMHREFVQTLDFLVPHFEDDLPALFLEGVTDVNAETGIGTWTGEDYWLCALAEREGLPMHVLLEAPCYHAGKTAMLDREGRIMVEGQDARERLEAGIAEKNNGGPMGPVREKTPTRRV